MKIKNGSCAAEVVKLLDFPYCYNKKALKPTFRFPALSGLGCYSTVNSL